jgi:hypothetical protein
LHRGYFVKNRFFACPDYAGSRIDYVKRAETLRIDTNKQLKKKQKELDRVGGILYTVKAASEWQKRDSVGA